MSDFHTDLYLALKSLKNVIPEAFIFENTFATMGSVFDVLLQDIKLDTKWYDEHRKESFQLLSVVRQILRYILTNIDVSPIDRGELVYLRKALTFTTLHSLREEIDLYWERLKNVIRTTKLYGRLNQKLQGLFNFDLWFKNRMNDFISALSSARKNFETLQIKFPNHEVAKTAKICESKLPTVQPEIPDFSIFAEEEFVIAAYSYGEYILSLDPQTDRLLSKCDLEKVKTGKFDIVGSFGHIMNTCLKYHKVQQYTDTLSLQLVQKDTICKVSNKGKARLAGELTLLIKEKHESLINIIGFTIHWGAFCIAIEPIDRTLAEVLHGSKRVSQIGLTEPQVLSVLSSICNGLTFLHSKGLVHGDIRPENIYIPLSLTTAKVTQTAIIAKLGNLSYGLNHFESRWQAVTTEDAIPYRSPEVLDGSRSTAASDVYSLAICTWEMFQDKRKPFDHCYPDGRVSKSKLIRSVKSGDRPRFRMISKTEYAEPKWAMALITKSWKMTPWERPFSNYWQGYVGAMVRTRELNIPMVNQEFAVKAKRTSVNSRISHVSGVRPMLETVDVSQPQEVPRTPNSPIRKPRPYQKGHVSNSSLSVATIRDTVGVRSSSFVLIENYEKRKEEVSSEISSDDATGLTKEEVEPELKEFVLKHDPKLLEDTHGFEVLVNYCIRNGYEKFNEEMIKEYGVGLERFEEKQVTNEKIAKRKTSRNNIFARVASMARRPKPKQKGKPKGNKQQLYGTVKAPSFNSPVGVIRKTESRMSIWETGLLEPTHNRQSVTNLVPLPELLDIDI